MIRFILVGNQVHEEENEFCFFNTSNMESINFDGDSLFESIEDFKFHYDHPLYKRCLRIIPKTYINNQL